MVTWDNKLSSLLNVYNTKKRHCPAAHTQARQQEFASLEVRNIEGLGLSVEAEVVFACRSNASISREFALS